MSHPPNQIRVLIVDDCSEDQETYRRLLHNSNGEDQAFVVTEAHDGQEAIACCSQQPPDCVLLDYSLPDMNGIEFLELLAADGISVPVVMLTGQGNERVAVQAMKAGARDYLVKGRLSWAALSRAIGNAIEKENLERQITEKQRQLKNMLEREQELSLKLQAAVQQADSANRAKSEFLAKMSHEIRTPMTAVLGYADLVYEGLDQRSKLRPDVQVIRTNGKYLLELLNDILDLSKVEAGKLAVEQIPCSAAEMINNVVAALRIVAHQKGLMLQAEYGSDFPEHITTDPIRLRQALVNLVSNALKFTERGSVRILAQMLNRDHSPTLELKIVDTGMGISEDKLQTIFEPFNQASASITRRFGGTGLGLTISKRIAQALGGDLTVRSSVGQGTTFTLTVRAGSLEGVQVLPEPLSIIGGGHPDDCVPGPTLRGRVLLAEDTLVNQRLISVILESMGLEVVSVADGRQALEAALAEAFDVILMDMCMPAMDGVSATRELRRRGYQKPIIALTASVLYEDREKCLDAGCNGFLTKPIDRRAMATELAKFLAADRDQDTPLAPRRSDSGTAAPYAAAPADPIQQLEAMERLQLDRQTYVEILEQSIQYLQQQVGMLCTAVQNGDRQSISDLSHAIASSAGNVGMTATYTTAKQLEHAADTDLEEDLNALFRQLDVALRTACDYGRQELCPSPACC